MTKRLLSSAAEAFGDLDGLVDGHDRRDVVPVQHLVDGQPQDVAVHDGEAAQFVVLGVAGDALVGLGAVVEHALDQRQREIADRPGRGTQIPELGGAGHAGALVEITEDEELHGRLAAFTTFTHGNERKKEGYSRNWAMRVGDGDGGAGRLDAAAVFGVQAADLRLRLVLAGEHLVDDRECAWPGRFAAGRRSRLRPMNSAWSVSPWRMTPEREDGVDLVVRLGGEFLHDDGNLERPRHLVEDEPGVGDQAHQFLGRVIDEALDVDSGLYWLATSAKVRRAPPSTRGPPTLSLASPPIVHRYRPTPQGAWRRKYAPASTDDSAPHDA